jgi:hypothetical protein
MSTRKIIVACIVSGLVASSVVAVMTGSIGAILGVGPSAAGGSYGGGAGATVEPVNGSNEGSVSEETVELEFEAGETRSCGKTCRVTPLAITNTGTADATNVVSNLTVTADGEELFTGTEEVGTIEASETVLVEQPIDIGVLGGVRFAFSDQFTITDTITHDDGTREFEDTCESIEQCDAYPPFEQTPGGETE